MTVRPQDRLALEAGKAGVQIAIVDPKVLDFFERILHQRGLKLSFLMEADDDFPTYNITPEEGA